MFEVRHPEAPGRFCEDARPADQHRPTADGRIRRASLALLETTRPCSSLVAGMLTASAAIAGPGGLTLRSAAAGLAMTTMTMFGFVVNDMFDYHKDRAAGIQRPLAAGNLSMKGAAWLAIATLLASALMGALAGPGAIVLAIASVMLVLYSPLAQRYTLCKDLYVAILCCLPLDYGGAVGGRGYPWFSYALVACFVIGRELLMDADEMAGDIRFGMRTIAAILGRHETARIGMVLMILAAAATAAFVHGRLAVGMSAAGVALLAGILTWPGLEQRSRISLSRVPMLLGAIAVACGGFS